MERIKGESCWKRLVPVLFADFRGGEGRSGLFP